MSELQRAIKSLGVSEVAMACEISPRAVYKWLKKGTLPRTELYGKTNYALTIERLTCGQFNATTLLEESRSILLEL